LPKNSSTLSFSSLDLLIGQASLTTCSGRVSLQVERVGEKSGKTVSGGGDWFSRTRDGRHRAWRSARHGVVTVWGAGDGQVELKGDGQPITGCDDRHPEAEFFISLFSRWISSFLRMEASIAVYLKHSHTTQHNIDKTREFRPKLHTKRAEMMLCFTCYHYAIRFYKILNAKGLCRWLTLVEMGTCLHGFNVWGHESISMPTNHQLQFPEVGKIKNVLSLRSYYFFRWFGYEVLEWNRWKLCYPRDMKTSKSEYSWLEDFFFFLPFSSL